MSKFKRKKFFLKDNFQLAFITGFILLLLFEVMLAGFFIYKLSAKALEEAAFSSHINIISSEQLIKPVVLKVNIYTMLTIVLIAGLAVAIANLRLHALFSKIIKGLENLKDNNTSFCIEPRGRKQTRELIKEFNQAASYLDKRLAGLRHVIDPLIEEKELKHIVKLHNKLYSIITGNNRE